jgi:hypothetical protein
MKKIGGDKPVEVIIHKHIEKMIPVENTPGIRGGGEGEWLRR